MAWPAAQEEGHGDAVDAPGAPRAAGGRNDPASGTELCAHEALLVRHGLIDHVAALPDGTPDAEAARFRADMARIARNVIPLSERRFGLLLGGGPSRDLSQVPHRLEPAGAAPPAGRDAGATDLAPSERPQTLDTVPRPRAAPPRPAQDAAQPGVETRLAAIEAHLAALSADTVSARIEARLDSLLSDRLDALVDRLPALIPPAATVPHPAPVPAADLAIAPDRAANFWAGMEQALRLLHDTAGRFEAAAAAQAAPDIAPRVAVDVSALVASVAGLEDAISLGLEAADSAREGQDQRLHARLEALERDIAGLTAALAGLAGQTGAAASGRDAADDLVQRVETALAARLAPIAGDVASAHDVLRQIADMLAAALAQFDRRMAEMTERLVGVSAIVEADQGAAEGVWHLSHRIDALDAALTARGGVLSEALETSKRSMKNFWLASEDVLQRIEGALSRLDAVCPSEGPVAPRQRDAVETGRTEAPAALSDVAGPQGMPGQGPL